MKRRSPLNTLPAEVSALEPRLLLTPLIVTGTNRADDIELSQDGDTLTVTVNGNAAQYTGYSSVVVVAGNGDDSVVSQNLSVPILVLGGNGDDSLLVVASTANNTLDGGNGNDLVSSTGAGSDVLIGGNGRDTLYGIVGAPNVVLGGRGKDRLITRDGVETHDASRQDTLVAFRFDRPKVELRDGVLYLMGDGGNDTYVVDQRSDRLFVTLRDNSGFQRFTFYAREVDQLAGILFGGDDLLLNQTDIGAVFYGTGGSDTLAGGSGDDVLKGGSEDDVILGNGGRDFLTGDAGADFVFGSGFILPDDADVFADLSFLD